jgi:hypothetical protein
LPGNAGADVRLVLVVRRDDLDRDPLPGGVEILRRHARRNHGPLARQIGIDPRPIVQHPKLNRYLGVCSSCRDQTHDHAAGKTQSHSPLHVLFLFAQWSMTRMRPSDRHSVVAEAPRGPAAAQRG